MIFISLTAGKFSEVSFDPQYWRWEKLLGFLSLCIFYFFKLVNIILVLCEAVGNLKKNKKLSLHISSKCLWCKIGPTGYAHREKYSIAVRWNPAKGAPYCLAIFRTSQDEAEVKIGIENSRLNSFLLNHLIVEGTTTLDFDLNTAPCFLISL